VTNYKTKAATKEDVSQILEDWKGKLKSDQYMTLEMELALERPLFICKDIGSEHVMAVFDILSTGTHNKNMRVFFSPDFASHDGLTSVEVDTLTALLISMLLDMLAMSELDDVRLLKIHSSDRLLLSAFRGFATYLAGNGHCRVKSYSNWIEIDELNLFCESVIPA